MQAKFMQSLNPDVYAELDRLAKERGISVQELVRAVVVPEWIRNHDSKGNDARPNKTNGELSLLRK